ncbi:MAG: methylamine utilization protein [Candidatus Riflebacteria bacterium]|nr:methylamine utilization protein [Candidatus Riflebacteria bacterium]
MPRVTAIQTGTQIEFPNHDTVQHHVYSFSKPKRFDLPLYKTETPQPVLFDKPGVVVLGCNIHDWMKAYVYVTDTPYFSKCGADGILKISNLPPGTYNIEFWHPQLKKFIGKGLGPSINLDEKKDFSETIAVELKSENVPSRTRNNDIGGY